MTHHAAEDWITIWQSELTALASNREAQENWARTMGTWVNAARDAATAWQAAPQSNPPKNASCGSQGGPGKDDPSTPPRSASSDAPPRPTAAATASGDGTSAGTTADLIGTMARELDRLRIRVEDLERRLGGTSGPETTQHPAPPA